MPQANRSGETKEERRFAPVARLIIWCAPALILLLVSVFRIGVIPNRGSLPSLAAIALAGLIVTRIVFLLASRRNAGKKAALLAVWIAIFAAVGFIAVFMPRTVHRAVKTDAQSRFEADIPRLFAESVSAPIEIGTAESAEYHTFDWSALAFGSRSWVLLCRYDEEEYERAAASVEERFRFRTEPLGTGRYDDDGAKIVDDPYAVIGNDRFRMLDPADGDVSEFYKGCFLVMTNDIERQIAYIVFSDDDLDTAESLEALIAEYRGVKYLRP